jgi:hypothetical protein
MPPVPVVMPPVPVVMPPVPVDIPPVPGELPPAPASFFVLLLPLNDEQAAIPKATAARVASRKSNRMGSLLLVSRKSSFVEVRDTAEGWFLTLLLAHQSRESCGDRS